jgi:hypothetical protein
VSLIETQFPRTNRLSRRASEVVEATEATTISAMENLRVSTTIPWMFGRFSATSSNVMPYRPVTQIKEITYDIDETHFNIRLNAY